MEICPEWEVLEVFIYGIHLFGVGNEKPEPLFKSSSMADNFMIWPKSFNLTWVVRITLPSPAYDKTLTLVEFPSEYILVGMDWSTDFEMMLN